MPSESIIETNATAVEETLANDPNEDATSQTEPVASTLDAEKEPRSPDESLEDRVKELVADENRKKRFCGQIAALMEERESLRLEYSQLGKSIKGCTDKIEGLLKDFVAEENSNPLFGWKESKAEPTDGVPTASDADAWRAWKIVDFFQLTEKQYEKLGLTESSKVGELSDLIAKLANGEEKIAGVGPGMVDKINEQFDVFWQMPEYKALSNPAIDADSVGSEPREPETDFDDDDDDYDSDDDYDDDEGDEVEE